MSSGRTWDPDRDSIDDYYDFFDPRREQDVIDEDVEWKWVLKNDIKNDNCAICQQKLNNGTLVMQLSCGHQFHNKCIDTICKYHTEKQDDRVNFRNVECPLCRKKKTFDINLCMSADAYNDNVLVDDADVIKNPEKYFSVSSEMSGGKKKQRKKKRKSKSKSKSNKNKRKTRKNNIV